MVSRKVRNQFSQDKRQQNSAGSEQPVSRDEPALEAEPVTVISEVVEELTEEELEERQQLELKVERSFVGAGVALRELRNRRLYRNTHKSFEKYCQERFGFSKRGVYYLIDSANVIDNLQKSEQIVHVFPTKESQCRPLAKLEPDEQCSIWQQAVDASRGKVPSARVVKSIVDRLKEKPLPQIPLSYKRNDAFILQGLPGAERRYNDCWAIAREILEFSLIVETHDGSLQVRPDNLEPIDDRSVRRQLAALLKRIQRLRKRDLDRGALAVLESLGKQTFLTEVEEGLLSWLESFYKVS